MLKGIVQARPPAIRRRTRAVSFQAVIPPPFNGDIRPAATAQPLTGGPLPRVSDFNLGPLFETLVLVRRLIRERRVAEVVA
jgi:hypothetical protein